VSTQTQTQTDRQTDRHTHTHTHKQVVGELGTVHMTQILSVLGELDVVPREGVQNAVLVRAQQLVAAFSPEEANPNSHPKP